MRDTLNISLKTLIFLWLCMMAAGCSTDWEDEMIIGGNAPAENPSYRKETTERRKLLLLYSAGHNNLRDYLLDDIKDLKQGWIPDSHSILLVYTHTPSKRGSYSEPSTPHLIRLMQDDGGNLMADTLKTYPTGTISSSPEQVNEVLNWIKSQYRAHSYGMIFSSHATGWLPEGYFSDPEGYRPKSIGQDQVGSQSYEMDIKEFAESIPMKFDYILFDACLMGGIEVAYELRGKCGKVGFSQAEVLAEGLDYKTLTGHLLKGKEANPQAVCEDYFKQYDVQSGVYRSATISLIDCNSLEPLAAVCKDIFANNREGLAKIDYEKVQRFYRYSKHWFYDLESILMEAGATAEELEALHSALDECVLYKGHTPEFMSEFTIDVFSGFSMYLPCHGSPELDRYYRTLKWNMATELVK